MLSKNKQSKKLLERSLEFHAARVSPFVWVKNSKFVTERGVPFEFKKHAFMIDILDDLTPQQVVMKASQVGFSVTTTLKVIWGAYYKDWSVIYSLPSQNDVFAFVPSKVNQLIKLNPILSELIADKSSVEQKQIGNSFIYWKGTAVSKEALMITADLYCADELDASKESTVEQYFSRLQYSDYKGRWYFSNPSTPNYGVHRYWKVSDQKHWFFKCSRCNHWQYMDWHKNVNRDKRIYICQKCEREIRPTDIHAGKWVKKYLNRDISGYWVPQTIATWLSCDELLELEETKPTSQFYNFVLGLPYLSADIQITRDSIVKNIVLGEAPQKKVAMGVDQGKEMHYVLRNEDGVFEVGKAKSWEEIERIAQRHNAVCVADAMPSPSKPKELAHKYRGRFFACFYKKGFKAMETLRWGKGKDLGLVYADRNERIQIMIDEFNQERIKVYVNQHKLEEFIHHFENLYRKQVVDSLGVPGGVWEHKGRDDYVHALVYANIALEKLSSTGEGAVVGGTETRKVGGAPSFDANIGPVAPPIIEAKPEKDWRYQ